jgi:hypothetical protein
MRLNKLTRYVEQDGSPTDDFIREARLQERRVAALEAKLAAIAAVTGPTGGATTDAEARTAINAIISGAS